LKFGDRYPWARSVQAAHPESLMGPHPEMVLTPEVSQTFRLFPCCICNELTGFRVSAEGTETPCCSEECQTRNEANLQEVRGTEEKEKIDIGPVDSGNQSEVQVVAPQSEQSSSTDGNQGVSNVEPLRSEPPVGEPS